MTKRQSFDALVQSRPGMTYREVMDTFSVSRPTAFRWLAATRVSRQNRIYADALRCL